jgi:hypothetical protein
MPAGNERGKMLPRSCQMASRFFTEEPPNPKRAGGPMFMCLVMGATLDRLEGNRSVRNNYGPRSLGDIAG